MCVCVHVCICVRMCICIYTYIYIYIYIYISGSRSSRRSLWRAQSASASWASSATRRSLVEYTLLYCIVLCYVMSCYFIV